MFDYLLLLIVFNNIAGVSNLSASWGFGAWVADDSNIVLFDTGDNGKILLNNLDALGLAPEQVNAVVVSHIHWDHIGGLSDFLKVARKDVKVYVPESILEAMSGQFHGADFVAVDDAQEIFPGVWTTGQLMGDYRGSSIPEQALIINTNDGLVVVTGCSHPGVVNIVQRAHELFPDIPILLVTGGFHLGAHSKAQVEAIADSLKSLGVQQVAPSHCTGERAIEIFRKRWGDNFKELFLGAKFEVGK